MEGFKIDLRSTGESRALLAEIFNFAANSARAGDFNSLAFLGFCSIQQTGGVDQMIIALLGFKCCEMSDLFDWIGKIAGTHKSKRHTMIQAGQQEIMTAFLPRLKSMAPAEQIDCDCPACSAQNDDDLNDDGSGIPLDPTSFH